MYLAKTTLAHELGTKVEVGSVDFGLPNWAILRNVTIYDKSNLVAARIQSLEIELIDFSYRRMYESPDSLQSLTIGRIDVSSPEVLLYRRCNGKTNLSELIPPSNQDTTKIKKEKKLHLDIAVPEILIENGKFSYIDSLSGKCELFTPGRINFANLSVTDVNVFAKFALYDGGRMEIAIEQLDLKEKHSGFVLNGLQTNIISETPIYNLKRDCWEDGVLRFHKLHVVSGKTNLNATVRFPGQSLEMLVSGKYGSDYRVDLNKSSFDFSILDYFVTQIPPRGVVTGQGVVYGSFQGVRTQDFSAQYAPDIAIVGDISVQNFLKPENILLDINVKKGTVSGKTIRELLPKIPLPAFLDNIPKGNFTGTFVGTPFDFQVNTDIKNPLGEVVSALHIQIPPKNPKVSAFTLDGHVKTQNFNFDAMRFVPETPISKAITFDGDIKLVGTDWKTMQIDTRAVAINSTFLGFKTDSVFTDIKIENQRIAGYAWLSEGNTRFDAKIDIDVSNTQSPAYKIDGVINRLNLQKYGIYDKNLIISSRVALDAKGKKVDEITGNAHFKNLTITKDEKHTLKVTDLIANVLHPVPDSTYLTVNSSLGDIHAEGRFLPMGIIADGTALFKEIQLYIGNNDTLIRQYYANKKPNNSLREMDLEATTGPELNRLFDFLDQPLYISDTSKIRVELGFSQSNFISLRYHGDSLSYDSTYLSTPAATVNLIKYADKNTLLLSGNATSDILYPWGKGYRLERNDLLINALGNEVDITAVTEQMTDVGKNTAVLNAHATLYTSGKIDIVVDSATTDFGYQNYNLRISKQNAISFYKGDFHLDTLKVYTDSLSLNAQSVGTQSIMIVGDISKDPNLPLNIYITELPAVTFSSLYNLGFQLGGWINARAEVYDIYKEPRLIADGVLHDLAVNQFVYGDVVLESRWDNVRKKVNLNTELIAGKDTFLMIQGDYNYRNKSNPLDFRISTPSPMPLQFVKPFVGEVIYDVNGTLNLDNVVLSGNFKDLQTTGKGMVRDATFGIDYFQTKYSFNGDVRLSKNKMEIERLLMHDKNNHTAAFYGTIRHKNFQDFLFDFELDKIDDFLIIDTKKSDNELFYGTIYVKDGLVSIYGDIKRISINAFGVTGKNSMLKLPLSSTNAFGMPDYITFYNPKQNINVKPKSGLELDLNLTIKATEEAEAEMIFDEKIGDIIRGRGNGTISLIVNPQGDFNMYGIYEITSGEYLFTSQNLVNKNFKVKPGGRILWDGDATQAQLDLQAYYPIKNANVKGLLNLTDNVYVPVNVLMRLQGDLMRPTIEPNIEFPTLERAGVSAQLANELNAKQKSFEFDPQELNRQVVTLLLANQFAPDNTSSDAGANTGANVGGLAATSISEFVSNQVNYWLSKTMTDKVNVSFSTSNLQDINLLLSAKFFNDRLTIERDGTIVGNNTGMSIGNINASLKLLPAANDTAALADNRTGELNLEVFNRSTIGSQLTNANQVGTGIFYRKDFDTFKDFWKRGKRKKTKPVK